MDGKGIAIGHFDAEVDIKLIPVVNLHHTVVVECRALAHDRIIKIIAGISAICPYEPYPLNSVVALIVFMLPSRRRLCVWLGIHGNVGISVREGHT